MFKFDEFGGRVVTKGYWISESTDFLVCFGIYDDDFYGELIEIFPYQK